MLRILVCVLLIAFSNFGISCSTIDMSSEERQVVAKNLDWPYRNGILIIHPRNKIHHSQHVDNPLTWQSRYGSFIFHGEALNEAGPASDGINEKGLQVSVMVLKESDFGKNDKPELNMGMWSQYILDNFQSVEEVIQHLGDYQLRKEPYQGYQLSFHLYIHDSKGHQAIIEFDHGGPIIYRGKDLSFHVLTNSYYQQALDKLNDYHPFGGSKSLPGEYDSLSRFVRAATFKKKLPEFTESDRIGYAFDGLSAVAQPPGARSTTQLSMVFDIDNQKIYYRSVNKPQVFVVNMRDYDFDSLVEESYIPVF